MASEIVEWFGYPVTDMSRAAADSASREHCPFIDSTCTKRFRDGQISGVCTLKQATKAPVVCCPNRLYGDDWQVLRDIADVAFGSDLRLVPGRGAHLLSLELDSVVVGVFGKKWGGELPLPKRSGTGNYYVDYILALIGPGGLSQFLAVEVQSIDTTGNYQGGWQKLVDGRQYSANDKAGLNWENVSKRILPQLIYKGNVLQQEAKCEKGLFFVTPKAVYDEIMDRLVGTGNSLPEYPLKNSSITFLSYDPAWELKEFGRPVPLMQTNRFTTSHVQVAQAFSGVSNLPPAGAFEAAILTAMH